MGSRLKSLRLRILSVAAIPLALPLVARPIDVAARPDSSHGAALLGLVGLGLIPTMDQAAAIAARTAKRVIPIAANVTRYERQFDLYREIHRRIASVGKGLPEG